MIRLRRLLALDGQGLYDALQGHRWSFVDWLVASRSYMRHMPAWKFWPLAIIKWPGFRRMQQRDDARMIRWCQAGGADHCPPFGTDK